MLGGKVDLCVSFRIIIHALIRIIPTSSAATSAAMAALENHPGAQQYLKREEGVAKRAAIEAVRIPFMGGSAKEHWGGGVAQGALGLWEGTSAMP